MRWVIYLALIAVGFYFGKYAGAVLLPALYFYGFQRHLLFRRQPKQQSPKPDNKSGKNTWAYRVLGISEEADRATIIKARKQQLNRYHPDKLPPHASALEKQRANDKIDEINRAFTAIIQDK